MDPHSIFPEKSIDMALHASTMRPFRFQGEMALISSLPGDGRPDPDTLLASVEKEAKKRERGRLKVFFGAAPGVGKTYAMLRYGIDEQAKGREVLAGVVETHQRSDTEALARQLERLPLRRFPAAGGTPVLEEFDLDAALARHPSLLLLDELPHSNVTGSRHAKRWQDLEELLDAGIDIATTINVQHLESANDVIFAITGVRVRETVPDYLITSAEELNLIDISEDDLLQRLRENKVYLGEKGTRAMAHFFRRGNLIALRQLAMRVAADRMDSELQEFRSIHPEDQKDGASLREKVLVAITAAPESEQLIRTGYRLSQALHCGWMAVHVDTPRGLWQRPQDQAWLWSHMHLAEQLGAETVRITGVDVAGEIIAYARLRRVSRIIVGPSRGLGKYVGRGPGSLPWQLLRQPHPNIDVLVHPLELRGQGDGKSSPVPGSSYLQQPLQRDYPLRISRPILASALAGILLTAAGVLLSPLVGSAGFFLLSLLGAVGAALRYGRWPSIVVIVSAQISLLAFGFGFGKSLPHTLETLLPFGANIAVAIIVSQLVARSRDQELMARMRERRARNLYTLVQSISGLRDSAEILSGAARQIHDSLGLSISFWLAAEGQENPQLHRHASGEDRPPREVLEALRSAALWVFRNRRPAGMGTDTLSALPALMIPMMNGDHILGIMDISDLEFRRIPGEWLRYLETISRLVASALESASAAQARSEDQMRLRLEKMQNTLLSAISHDLRTPLTAMLGALSTLEQFSDSLPPQEQLTLIRSVREQTQRMGDNMDRILRMASLLSGGASLNREWVPLGDILGIAMRNQHPACAQRKFNFQISPDLPLLHADPVLLAQVVGNLVENACRYTPPDTAIDIQGWADQEKISVCVIDHGFGIPPGREEAIFERFSQISPPAGEKGSGLGLAIARTIVEMHEGRIWATNLVMNRGARFCFSIPRKPLPILPEEE